MSGPLAAVTGLGLLRPGELSEPARDARLRGVDLGRLRRMDRFGRAGFLAGSLALVDAGVTKSVPPDPRAGAIFGTAFGCRDSITEHARLLRAAARVEDLAPAVFAQTVHNTVCGELAIEWGLGGVSETVVSGRCAGLEALLFSAGRIAEGAADRIVAGGAEGLDAGNGAAWEVERSANGPAPAEAGAAIVLEREGAESARAWLLGGESFFEPDASEAPRRLQEAARKLFGALPAGLLLLGPRGPDRGELARALERLAPQAVRPGGDESDELFGASGPAEVVRAVQLLREGAAPAALVVVREREGSTAFVALRAAG